MEHSYITWLLGVFSATGGMSHEATASSQFVISVMNGKMVHTALLLYWDIDQKSIILFALLSHI